MCKGLKKHICCVCRAANRPKTSPRRAANGRIAVKFLCKPESLAGLKEEQSMTQNGFLCSVIVGNLVEVSLATQTWFLAEDEERWCCLHAAVTTLTSNRDFAFSSLLPSAFSGRDRSSGVDVAARGEPFRNESKRHLMPVPKTKKESR